MEVFSPDGQIRCEVTVKKGELYYAVNNGGKTLVDFSKLGFEVFGVKNYTKKICINNIQIKSHTETIEMPWGEDKFIDNNYNELIVYTNKMNVYFRVFNDAVAFRYEILKLDITNISIADELTEFNISGAASTWSIPAYQKDRYEYNYEKSTISELDHPIHTPLTIKVDNTYLSIHEAALYNYGAMNIIKTPNGILKSDITPLSDTSKAHLTLPFKTPWRLIMIADSAINLTKNRTMYALNDPPSQDFSWVKTLKFLGIWWAMYVGEWTWAPGDRHGATTAHAKEYIDAAVRLGIRGLLVEGWNDGWEGNWLENGDQTNFINSEPDFNLKEVVNYAIFHDVEFVVHNETVGFINNYESQIEKAYRYYNRLGIHYIKTGYAGSKMMINGREEYHHSQLGVNHYQKTVELAAKYHIALDIHEPIKSTGIERTFPNLLTREGARGQEYENGSLKPSHACILPFTRLLAGGMDYTPGILDLDNPIKHPITTISRQLAYFVTIYSGMVMVSDRPTVYQRRFPEFNEFLKSVPTNFEKTVPLMGEIGEYYIVARKDRESNDWYIGGVTNEKSRNIKITCDFLEDGLYSAEIYCDSHDAHYEHNPFAHEIKKIHLKNTDPLELYLAPGGGFAIKVTKISKN